MKTPVTITILIVGGCLLLAPFAFSALHDHEIASMFIARSDLTHISLDGESCALTPVSRFGCWLTGSAMILVAMVGAARDARRSASFPVLASGEA